MEYTKLMPDALRRFKAEVFQALAHPTRIAIVELLRNGPLPAGKLIEQLGIEQANASQHLAVQNRQKGAAALCQQCQTCPVLAFCGGGYLPNRYSAARGFDNPSVFCTDLETLIRHIHARVAGALDSKAAALV